MKCARCDLELPPGARHVAAEDCVEALRAALAASCPKCGGKIGCLKCAAKRALRTQVERRYPGAGQALRILGEVLRPEDE